MSAEMPTAVKLLFPYFCWSSMKDGISRTQPPQVVAQKLTRTTLPRKSGSCVVFPESLTRWKLGAGLRSAFAISAAWTSCWAKAGRAVTKRGAAIESLIEGRERRVSKWDRDMATHYLPVAYIDFNLEQDVRRDRAR